MVEKIHEFSLPPIPDDIKRYRHQRRKMLIPKLVVKFQMQTSKQINILRNSPELKNWQANYHDHVICTDAAYQRIKNYIVENPLKWDKDTFNNGTGCSRENS